MPNNIRAGLTAVVILVCAVVFYLEHRAEADFLKWLALGLGAFMVYAIWLFPETKTDPDRTTEGDAAQ